MRRNHLLLLLFLAIGTLLHAQAPQSVTLQSVLRNASGQLVANQSVSVRITILRGSASGLPVYTETHRPTTNPYGLYSVLIGQGTTTLGSFSSIDWGNGPYYLSVEADPAGGTAYTLTVSQPLVSVPYALFADTAAHVSQAVTASNATTSIYADTAYYTIIADTARYFQEQQVLSIDHDTIYLTGGSYVVLPAGFSGDYNDLINQPTIPTIPTNVSTFINDAGYITGFTEQQVLSIGHDTIYLTGGSFVVLPASFSGDYNDLTNQPTIPTVPTNVSAFINDAGYITSFTEQQVLSISNDTIYLTGGSYVVLPPAGNSTAIYNYIDSVVNATPSVYADTAYYTMVADTARYFQEQQVLSLSNDTIYLTGGSYVVLPPAGNSAEIYNYIDSVVNTTPSVYADTAYYTMVADTAHYFQEQQVLSISHDTIYLTGGSFVKLPAGFSGDYNDLTNKPSLFSGDYNDLTNQPTIPTVPTNVSAFINDAGYLTSVSEQQVLSIGHDTIYLTGGSFVKLPAGFSGDYNDLINQPTIPTIPTNVSAFINDAGYITSFTEQQVLSIGHDTIYLTGGSFVKLPAGFSGDYNDLANRPSLFSGDYNDLTNQPTIPTVPTNVSVFTNDAGYLTSFAEQQALSISHDTIYLTGGSFVKLPASFSGDYNDLTNKPTIPTVPTNVSAFINDAGYITSFTEQQVLSISHDTIYLTGGSFVKLPAGFSGDYNDLTNQPTIPTVPTNVSAFINDAGYITSFTEQQVLSISHDTIYLTGGSYVVLPTAFSGDYNDLSNKPTIPTVPTNVSEFINDAGYLTSFTEQQVLSIGHDTIYLTGGSHVVLPAAFSGDYNDLSNKPTLFSGDYNDLTNQPTIPTVPTNVSAFTNDAGYLTNYTETQTLSDVTANGNLANSQIKNVSDPTDGMDAVNKRTLDSIVAALVHQYDSIITYQQHIIDTLKRVTNISREAFDSNGATYAVFSVSPTKKVRFSRGNLQYTRVGSHSVQGGGTAPGTWRFAPNQWEYRGTANNNASSSSNTGYIDMFYPGTSGWNNHYPYSTTSYGGNYSGENANSDWGVYNAISNGGDTPGMWRTLTADEWNYVLSNSRMVNFTRGSVFAIVNGVDGVLIFPDECSPEIASLITTRVGLGETLGPSHNNFSQKQFEYLEKYGCVFLPKAGYKSSEGTFVGDNGAVYTYAQYSTSTLNKYYWMMFNLATGHESYSGGIHEDSTWYKRGGSVRLVQDCEE